MPVIELSTLIHPLAAKDFFNDFYGRRSFCTSVPNPGIPVISIDDMVARIQCLESEFGTDYSLARDGEKLSPVFHASLVKNSDWLANLLQKNWTFVVNAVQRDFYPLNRLSAGLTGSLRSGVNINVYYTPAGAQGFDFHSDQHDVFIWQQSGRKAWKVIAEGAADDTEPVFDAILEPGQMLYIPERCRHAAVACPGEDSLHLTIGFSSRFAQAKKLLRTQVDDWMASGMTNGIADLSPPHLLPAEQSGISTDEALLAVEAFRQHLVRQMDNGVGAYPVTESLHREVSPEETVTMLAELHEDSLFTLRESGLVEPMQGGGMTFRFQSDSLVFKEEFREALDTLNRLRTFHHRDLPLDAPAARALCRVLVGAGVVCPRSA